MLASQKHIAKQQTEDPSDIATADEIMQRKILKIKRPGSEDGAKPVTATTGVQFFTNTVIPAEPTAPKVDFSGGSKFTATPKAALENLPEPTGISLFGSKQLPVSTAQGSSLFSGGTTPAPVEEKKQPTSLFDNLGTPNSGLFSGLVKPVPAEPIVEAKPAPAVVQAVPQAIIQESPEKPAQPTSGPVTSTSSGSLFGNSKIPTGSLFGNVSTGGFFGNSSQTPATQISFAGLTEGAKKEAEAPAAVQSSKPPSLFANVTSHGPPTFIPTKSGLFDGLLNSNVSNGTGCGTNLFGGNPTPLSNMFARPSGDAQAGGDDDEEANVDPDEEVVPGQEDKADPSKATGDYKYESKTSVLITKAVNNYKKGSLPVLGAGSVSLEKYENGTVFLIFRNGAKVILHNTMVIKKLSKSGMMKSRNDSVWVDTYEVVEGKPTLITCKIQFSDDDSCARFKAVFDELI